MEVLADMDVKGTGEIEFDEFIYFMTRPQVRPFRIVTFQIWGLTTAGKATN